MRGFITFGDENYRRAAREGRRSGTNLAVHLTITIDDIERFVTDPGHVASASGHIFCEALGGTLPVEHGWFQLFVDKGDPVRKEMRYRLYFQDLAGRSLTLIGVKRITNDTGFDLWSDTTTLFTRIVRGHISASGEAGAQLVASGIITVHLGDFIKQLASFRARGPGFKRRAAALYRFGAFFAGSAWDVYCRRVLATSPI
jgi:hypothetical protein